MPLLVRALALPQEEFAARCRIPLGTLRDREQGRSVPDQPAKAYLTVTRATPKVSRGRCNRCPANWRKLLRFATS